MVSRLSNSASTSSPLSNETENDAFSSALSQSGSSGTPPTTKDSPTSPTDLGSEGSGGELPLNDALGTSPTSASTQSITPPEDTGQQGKLDPEMAKNILSLIDRVLTGLGIPPGAVQIPGIPSPVGEGSTEEGSAEEGSPEAGAPEAGSPEITPPDGSAESGDQGGSGGHDHGSSGSGGKPDC